MRGTTRARLTVAQGAETGCQSPSWWPRRCLGSRPLRRRQGAGRSPPGSRAGLGAGEGGRGAALENGS